MSKKKLLKLDEELAFKLQAEEEEQARLARETAEKVEEANISWDNVQAMIEADRLLAERLQEREQEELTDEEKARLFVELLEKRKKHFAALRAQEKRNKPPTKAQKKSTMSTYLKHMAGADIAKIIRKRFKPGKHEHGNGRAHKEPEVFYKKNNTKATKPRIAQAGNPCELIRDITEEIYNHTMIRRNQGPMIEGRSTNIGA
ncbi:hypothetical protein Tco_0619950 [Tanacetum coccineum]